MAGRFSEFCSVFEHHFIIRGKDVIHHARHYLSGLLGRQGRKNMEQIEADVADSNYQGMQQFISDSPWKHELLVEQLAAEADSLVGGHRDTGLFLDESSFVKKGDASVGVQRQYCGRLGKTENCQVGVFACLGRGRHAALVDFRLFMPESWAQDADRCAKAKVPAQHRVHQTKTQLALQMVMAARERGSRHQWIGADEVYGNNQSFCAQLEDLGETFLMDVAHNTVVWDANPAPGVPAAGPGTKGKGRAHSSTRSTNPDARRHKIAALVEERFATGSRKLTLRESTQGRLQARLWVHEVWLWEEGGAQARRRLLVVRQEADGTFKYSLSNAASGTSWERLGYMQTQRFWIEQAFKEAKGELGMAHYEVRSWAGWHHHMALVCLAQLFTLRERIGAFDALPLLSTRDIVELLDYYLPRRPRDEQEVLRQLAARHQRRTQASKSHAKRRRKSNSII
jgi:SRSO17 transposase